MKLGRFFIPFTLLLLIPFYTQSHRQLKSFDFDTILTGSSIYASPFSDQLNPASVMDMKNGLEENQIQ